MIRHVTFFRVCMTKIRTNPSWGRTAWYLWYLGDTFLGSITRYNKLKNKLLTGLCDTCDTFLAKKRYVGGRKCLRFATATMQRNIWISQRIIPTTQRLISVTHRIAGTIWPECLFLWGRMLMVFDPDAYFSGGECLYHLGLSHRAIAVKLEF